MLFHFQVSGASVEETLVGDVILSVLKVTATKSALYTCVASNKHSSGTNTVKKSATVIVTGKKTGQSLILHPTVYLLQQNTNTTVL